MSNQIVPFDFDGAQVRVIAIDGEPWFVLTDLAKVLDIAAVGRLASRLDDGVRQTHTIMDSLGREQRAVIVSEAGMYEVVIRSDKPEAAAFRRWITGTVLPEIRRTGAFGQTALTEQEIVHQALQITARQVQELEAKVERDAPKVDYVDTFVADGDLRLLRNVAKSISMTESELRADLLSRKWIYAEHMTRWSESKREKETITRYSPYSHKAQYFEPVPNHYAPRFKGEVMHTLKVTPSGAVAIARLYGKHLRAVEEVMA